LDAKVEKQVADLIGENLDRQISEAASNMGNTVNALVEINVGLDRCGVSPGKPTLELVQKISKLKQYEHKRKKGQKFLMNLLVSLIRLVIQKSKLFTFNVNLFT